MAEMILDSKHAVVPVTGEEDDRQKRLMKGFKDGTIRLQPGGWYFNSFFPKFANSLFNFQYKSSDVIIMTYPKCGTTWTQEIVWTMLYNPNLDNPKADLATVTRSPMVDVDFLLESGFYKRAFSRTAEQENFPKSVMDEGFAMYKTKILPDPRVIKTHLPLSLMPPTLLSTSKVIYVARNPKAVCVSFYYHSKLHKIHDFSGTFDDYFDLFVNHETLYSPIIPHMLEGFEQRNHENLLFLYYEDMIENPHREHEKIEKFLNIHLTEDQRNNIVDYTNFDQMKERTKLYGTEMDFYSKQDSFNSDGSFFRKGMSHDWKLKLTEDQDIFLTNWIDEQTKGSDLKFA